MAGFPAPTRGDKMVDMPYMATDGKIEYVPESDGFLAMAKAVRDRSGCVKQRTGAVIVSPLGIVLGEGNNDTSSMPVRCPRDTAGFGTGQGYELCQTVCGQRPGRHAERDAIASLSGAVPAGSKLYLYGHWWCCKPCWDAMVGAGITTVVLLSGVGPDTDWGTV